jgi:hypothetical protein
MLIIAAIMPCAGANSAEAGAAALITPTARDGRHDFDFLLGTWRYHFRILRERLKGSHDWYDCYATGETHSIWNGIWQGSGNLEEANIRCPNRTIAGITLRMYDAQTHQWQLWCGLRERGLIPPPQTGHFNANGIGEFFADDTWKGTPVIVRYHWTHGANDRPHFEQAFSSDRGKTWETNWISDQTRV